jgi:hypothetical protein
VTDSEIGELMERIKYVTFMHRDALYYLLRDALDTAEMSGYSEGYREGYNDAKEATNG